MWGWEGKIRKIKVILWCGEKNENRNLKNLEIHHSLYECAGQQHRNGRCFCSWSDNFEIMISFGVGIKTNSGKQSFLN